MLELLTIIVFGWLLVQAVKLTFKITWGVAKGIAAILMAIAMPLLFVCLLFVGGLALLVPLAVIGIAFGILRACV
jgi:hypothetical protein